MLMSTPLGTEIGCFPILLMTWSPHVTENFAACAGFCGLPVGHQAVRRRDDRDAEAAEHARQRVALGVHAQARLRDALDAGDRALAVRPVLQRDLQLRPFGAAAHFEVVDVALAAQ